MFFVAQKLRLLESPNFLKGLAFSLLWCGIEYFKASIPLGFPWGEVGYLLTHFPILLQTADIFGIWGLSFIFILINYFIFFLIYWLVLKKNHKSWDKTSFYAFISVFLIILSYGIYREYYFNKVISRANEIKVAVIQGNIPQELKDKDPLFSVIKYLNLMNKIPLSMDLIITPETAIPLFFPDEKPSATILRFLREREKPVILGAFRKQGKKYFNSLFVIKEGKIWDIYDKERLVPFGEYIPYSNYLKFLRRFTPGWVDLSPGESKNIKIPLEKEKEFLATPLICFESAFSNILKKRVKDSELILIITNDAWFGNSSAPYQHFQMAIVRAVEGRKYTIQSANTGISGIIDPLGRVVKKTEMDKEEILYGKVKLIKEVPLFVYLGSFLGKLGFLLFIVLLIYSFLVNKLSKEVH